MNPADLFSVANRCALLTGAGRGIGLAMAQTLAQAGCAVAIQDIELEIAQQAAEGINQSGGRAIALGGDVGDLTMPAQFVAETVAQLGGLHILINNAAVQHDKHWLELSADEIQADFRTDLISPILCCQQAVPIFRRQKWGRIINLGSIQQRIGNPNLLPYSLSKAALEKLTIALARDLATENITVNQIAPGWIDTYRNRLYFTDVESKLEAGRRHIPMQRIGQPDDFRGIALFLCSDASSYLTGQTIYVDGGLSIK